MESCQRHKYLVNIWFLLFSWESHSGLNWPCILWTACGYHRQAIQRTTQNKTTRSSAVRLWSNELVRGNLFSERNKNAHTALMRSPISQIPCMRLTRHWLSMLRFHSGSALIGEQANVVTPELGTKSFFASQRLFDIVTRLLLCFWAQPQALSSTVQGHAERCGYKTQG